MSKEAIYKSSSSFKSLWQNYFIYDDHIEFETLFGHLSVPYDQVEQVFVAESDVHGLLKGNLQLKNFRPALKLDWANFQDHVVVDKTEGHIRRILFTPDDPETFIKVLNETIIEYKNKKVES